jgi:Uma2 family endonuclease
VAEDVPGKIPYAAYLTAEEHREIKHEYLDGIEREMAGGTIDHGRLASRFTALLGVALGDRPCQSYSSDVRVRIERANRSVYPDLSVACGRVEHASDDRHAIINPVAIVEILSDGTEAYDRGEKFRYYKWLPTLREYVLVSHREPLVEVFRREGDKWSVTEHGPGTSIVLASLDVRLSVDDLYRDPLAGTT